MEPMKDGSVKKLDVVSTTATAGNSKTTTPETKVVHASEDDIKKQRKWVQSNLKFVDISDNELCRQIIPCAKGIVGEGKHVRYLWKAKDSWGLVYRVMADVDDKYCVPGGEKSRSGKYLLQQYKLGTKIGKQFCLEPSKGFQCVETAISQDITEKLAKLII